MARGTDVGSIIVKQPYGYPTFWERPCLPPVTQCQHVCVVQVRRFASMGCRGNGNMFLGLVKKVIRWPRLGILLQPEEPRIFSGTSNYL